MTEITYEKEKDYGYRDHMLLCMKSEYLLDAGIRNLNGKSEYCYDVKNRRPMSLVYENTVMKGKDVSLFFHAMSSAVEKTQEHLLKCEGLVLSPDKIMLGSEDHTPAFIYCPAADPDYRENCIRLGEFLINKVDVTDEQAVKLCYDFYDVANTPALDVADFLKRHICVGIKSEKSGSLQAEVQKQPQPSDGSSIAETNKEQEQYYYKAPVYEDEEDDPLINIPEKGLLRLLIVCSALIVTAGSAYTYIFLNPGILKAAGISQKDYILAGALLTSIMAMIIITLLQMYVHRRRNNEESQCH